MRILSIETSCDETAVCLMEATGEFGSSFKFEILGNALLSQIAIHAPYGGVFPNLAKREHARNLVPLLEEVLKQSDLPCGGQTSTHLDEGGLASLKEILAREPELFERLEIFLQTYNKPDIDAIAVTHGPGLEPALWVGVNFARALSTVWNIPLVAVNHMEGHIVMSMVDFETPTSGTMREFEFPVLSLLISGGHTELVISKEFQTYELIGQTRDDAAGEAFDKVARLLGLPYPGGPEISRLAAEARSQNLQTTLHLTPPMLHSGDFDFSFSGIKTEVRRLVESKENRGSASRLNLDENTKKEIARAFEDAVTQVLVAKTMRAADDFGVQTLVVGGGVSANTHIRLRLAEALAEAGNFTKLLSPQSALATDNAIMIALAGYFRALQGEVADLTTLKANGNLKLAETL